MWNLLKIKLCFKYSALFGWPHLDGCHPRVTSHQNLSVQQLCNLGVLHLQVVPHQLSDVHLPVRAQHVAGLAPGICRLCDEVSQDSDHGVLVLQRTASSPPVLIVLLLTVPGWPGGGEKTNKRTTTTATQYTSDCCLWKQFWFLISTLGSTV